MTLEYLIELLKTSGIDSKHKVIALLETTDLKALYELRRSITERISKIKTKE